MSGAVAGCEAPLLFAASFLELLLRDFADLGIQLPFSFDLILARW